MTHYDLVVLGAGSGNTIVNHELAGKRVAIVERGAFGGTCINRGCIPSKMFIHPADVATAAAHGPVLGVATTMTGADWPAIRDRVFGRTDEVSSGGKDYREGQDHVDVLTGTARFTGPRTLVVALESGEEVEISGDDVVIATGGRPIVPDIPGLHDVEHHTSDTIMRLARFPARIGIVGGGYIGTEMAHVFASYGAAVTQMDNAPLLLDSHDADIAEHYTALARQRWDVRLEAGLEKVEPAPGATPGGAALLHLSDGSSVEVDVVLLAVGRRPNSDLLDLEKAGVEVDDAGRVVVDEHQRTTAPGVWALGDASSPEPLKHVANQDARVVQHNLLHPDDLMVSDHRFVPNAVFTSPQVAAVGLTEAQAREQGLDVAVGCRSYDDVAYGWAMLGAGEQESGHLVKLVGDRATGRLVGAHLLGPHASILVQPLILAMSHDLPVKGLARSAYWIHPALTEVVENALLELEKELGEDPRGPGSR